MWVDRFLRVCGEPGTDAGTEIGIDAGTDNGAPIPLLARLVLGVRPPWGDFPEVWDFPLVFNTANLCMNTSYCQV